MEMQEVKEPKKSKTTVKEKKAASLVIPSINDVKRDLAIIDEDAQVVEQEKVDPELDKKAESFVDMLMSVNEEDFKTQENVRQAVDDMGLQVQRKSAERSRLLRQPIKRLAEKGADGGDVAKALINLKMQVEELDPNKFDFEPGFFSRTLGFLPFIGNPLKRYFTKYESADTVIAAIVRSLDKGAAQLEMDNDTLYEDQVRMREMTLLLQKQIVVGQLIDKKLTYKLEREVEQDSPRYKFISEELLFPLRQRIMDLQQQLAVNQQGVISTELLRRINRELIKGVHRAKNTTIVALDVAASVAFALTNSRIVYKKIEALNKTTSDVIAGTAKRLRTHGAEVYKQSASAMLDMKSLKGALVDLDAALEDISSFRQKALPQMAQTILDLDDLTAKSEEAIQRMEEGNKVSSSVINIEVQ